MTVQIVPAGERVEEIIPRFVPLSAVKEEQRPTHQRVVCCDCGHHVCPDTARKTREGYLCTRCAGQ